MIAINKRPHNCEKFHHISNVLTTASCSKGGEGWMCLYIHLFVYICWSYRMVALMLCYNPISPSTFKEDISASPICHL